MKSNHKCAKVRDSVSFLREIILVLNEKSKCLYRMIIKRFRQSRNHLSLIRLLSITVCFYVMYDHVTNTFF